MLDDKLMLLLMAILDRKGPVEIAHADMLAMQTNNKILDLDVLDEETQLARFYVRDMTVEERQERELFKFLVDEFDESSDF